MITCWSQRACICCSRDVHVMVTWWSRRLLMKGQSKSGNNFVHQVMVKTKNVGQEVSTDPFFASSDVQRFFSEILAITWPPLVLQSEPQLSLDHHCSWSSDDQARLWPTCVQQFSCGEFHVIAQVYRVVNSVFLSQKLLQVAVNGLCISYIRSTQNVNKWCMYVTDTSMGFLLAISALDASFASRNMNFWFLSALCILR